MTGQNRFGRALARFRGERGFKSARAFFDGAGGEKTLGVSFVSYWNMESGKKLPKGRRLQPLLSALGLGPASPGARELVRAYMADLCGSDDLFAIAAGPAAAPAAKGLAEESLEKAMNRGRAHLSVAQWLACARDRSVYICNYFLLNTPGWVTLGEVRASTGFSELEAKRALAALVSAKLAKSKGGRFSSPYSRKLLETLPATPANAAAKAKLRAHMAGWVEGCERVASSGMTIRLSRSGLEACRDHIKKAVEQAAILGDDDRGAPGSAVYLVDAKVYRLFPRGQGAAGAF